MIHLICQDWLNTSGNHAGIKYLCEKLQSLYPDVYKVYCAPSFLPPINERHKGKLGGLYDYYGAKFKHFVYKKKLFKKVCGNIKNGDVVMLMEYMEAMYPMLDFAEKIRTIKGVQTYAMVHLVPQKLTKSYPDDVTLKKWVNAVDKIFTLGSSLTDYFVKRGVERSKIVTTFHYVDNYYFEKIDEHANSKVKVIAMGAQMRNNKLLSKICHENPNVDFTICQGLYDMSSYFEGCKNVRLVPYVSEAELKAFMKESDISLNSMEDTIGSNVVVTSLAMGLAMICSDVGSIRDYCDDANSIFCNNDNPDSFSNAINDLSQNRELLLKKRHHSQELAQLLTIEKYHRSLMSIIEKE